MKTFMSLLLVVLIVLTTGYHAYYVWKGKHYKMFFAQIGIAGIAVIAGIAAIYDCPYLSISRLLNALSPLGKEMEVFHHD